MAAMPGEIGNVHPRPMDPSATSYWPRFPPRPSMSSWRSTHWSSAHPTPWWYRTSFLKRLPLIRHEGYALEINEVVEGLMGMAAPLSISQAAQSAPWPWAFRPRARTTLSSWMPPWAISGRRPWRYRRTWAMSARPTRCRTLMRATTRRPGSCKPKENVLSRPTRTQAGLIYSNGTDGRRGRTRVRAAPSTSSSTDLTNVWKQAIRQGLTPKACTVVPQLRRDGERHRSHRGGADRQDQLAPGVPNCLRMRTAWGQWPDGTKWTYEKFLVANKYVPEAQITTGS